MRRFPRFTSGALVVLGAVVLFCSSGEAHKPITSKFTYNADVFPVFLNRCSHCHVAGGVAPMSLVTYEDAFPWAESLRAELLDAGSAAGGTKDSDFDFIKAAHRDLSARELDVVLDWAVGGNPEGAGPKPSPVALKNDWAGRTPDLAIQPAVAFEMPANLMEITQEVVLPTRLDRAREISAIDLLPGTPAVVRDATIAVRVPNAPPKKVGMWIPRQVPAAIALKPGTTLPAGADIIATIHYKKTWKYEGQAVPDRSAVGIYFADK
jgi:hypothetical protein